MSTHRTKWITVAVIVFAVLVAMVWYLVRNPDWGQEDLTFELTAGEDTITLTWEPVNTAERYLILRTEADGTPAENGEAADYEEYEMIAILGAGDASYVDANVEPGRSYAYIIEARKDGTVGGGRPVATGWTEWATPAETP